MSLPFYSNGPIAVSKMPEIINSQVVFGTPSRNCSGSGICKVYTIHGAKHLNISCEMVKVSLRLVNAQLLLSFPELACSAQLLQQHFTNEDFRVEERFYLPSWLSRKFGSSAVFVPCGNYPVQVKNGLICIVLPLKPHYIPS